MCGGGDGTVRECVCGRWNSEGECVGGRWNSARVCGGDGTVRESVGWSAVRVCVDGVQ